MSTIAASVEFAAGHRILGLEGQDSKCRNIHGHNFRATLEFLQDSSWPPTLDFGTIKHRCGGLIRSQFDHVFILDKADDFKRYLEANMLRFYETDGPPTTEKIAEAIGGLVIERLTVGYKDPVARMNDYPAWCPDAKLLSVRLEEGPVNVATWENPAYVKRYAQGGAVGGMGITSGTSISGTSGTLTLGGQQ